MFDLTSQRTITLPDTKGRFQSLMVVNQDHSLAAADGPKTVTLTEDNVGTRYVFLTIRTFVESNDEKDMKAAYRPQDAVGVKQADMGTAAVSAERGDPGWNLDVPGPESR